MRLVIFNCYKNSYPAVITGVGVDMILEEVLEASTAEVTLILSLCRPPPLPPDVLLIKPDFLPTSLFWEGDDELLIVKSVASSKMTSFISSLHDTSVISTDGKVFLTRLLFVLWFLCMKCFFSTKGLSELCLFCDWLDVPS